MDLLVISGGDHPYHETTPILVDFLTAAGHRVEATEDARVLLSDGMATHGVVVFNTLRAGDLTLAPGEQSALTRFIRSGKGFVCVHIASSRPETWHDYHDVTGGGWITGSSSHPPYGRFQVNVKKADHPAVEGIDDFVTNDELYTKLGWLPGNDVLLTADLDEKAQPIAWTRPYGAGKVFTTTLGHNGLSFQTPEFQRLIINGVQWVSATH